MTRAAVVAAHLRELADLRQQLIDACRADDQQRITDLLAAIRGVYARAEVEAGQADAEILQNARAH